MGDLNKDDKLIVKRLAENERYNLVERPRMLFSFDLNEQEKMFFAFLMTQNFSSEVFHYIAKALFDLVIVLFLCWEFLRESQQSYLWYGIAFLVVLALHGALGSQMNRLGSSYIMVWVLFQSVGILLSMCLFFLNGPKFHKAQLSKQAHQATFVVFQTIVFISRVIPFRAYIFVQVLMFGTITAAFFFYVGAEDNVQTYIIDTVLNLVYVTLLVVSSHNREMRVRKQYNAKRIIEVEIDKTEELLGKLVPAHVLLGIKNDQRVVDQLDNVTLLYTDMVGFTEFSKNHPPSEVVSLLSRLFSRFDQLCEQFGVYKVHTIGDCYVVSGFTGKVANGRRNSAMQIEEAYKVIQVGMEMINVI
jgi:uncharacterized membrane protein